MPETNQADWKKIAEGRGIPLSEAGAKSLEALDKVFAEARAALDWKEDTAVDFHPAGEERRP